MPRYTLGQLVQRANAGQIGVQGLRRLQAGGIDPGSIVHNGLGANRLAVDPNADIQARRAALYAHALQAAHGLQPGQTLSAGLQHRLSLGPGSNPTGVQVAPRSVDQLQQVQGAGGNNVDVYSQIMDTLRKRSAGIASQAGIYKAF